MFRHIAVFVTILIAILLSTASLRGQVLPKPQELNPSRTSSFVGTTTRVFATEHSAFAPQLKVFVQALAKSGFKNISQVVSSKDAGLILRLRKDIKSEEYVIRQEKQKLVVEASTTVGVAHAMATLLQLARNENNEPQWQIDSIRDFPDSPFRCFMVDMARSHHSPKTLKQIIDALWFYKVNYLQLHLTDDQLFSWPSKAFPKLQSPDSPWTLKEFQELEAYSQARGVTIIPELDVPGHSTILRREYPKVFGKTTTALASQESSQRGVETLIKEMLGVFKSTPYFHMGGDEAYGVPEETQRDFINRLNAFIKQQGKQTLAWEGPRLGEGKNKVSEDVIHMNWRTINFPAPEMIEAGYDIINASWDPLYIVDHYPRTMFTAVDMRRCYEFDLKCFAHVNHDIKTYSKPYRLKSTRKVLGFCMPWWEGREENVLKMCIPRLAATSCATWNRRGESSFEDFTIRFMRQQALLQKIARYRDDQPAPPTEQQSKNLALGCRVDSSDGSWQPVFNKLRLTNGNTSQLDHFLGYKTKPKPLEITVTLRKAESISRIVIHETAQGKSYEIYDLLVSKDGKTFDKVGSSKKGTRGEKPYVEHSFESQSVQFIKVRTQGCHGLTFPSFSRLTEIEAFRK